MKKIIYVLIAGLIILSGCSSSQQSVEDKIATQILDDFESKPEDLLGQPKSTDTIFHGSHSRRCQTHQ
jgi:PBP1b-binding outer membrane lipoprotein LpoB